MSLGSLYSVGALDIQYSIFIIETPDWIGLVHSTYRCMLCYAHWCESAIYASVRS